jgi:hypothetical protein
VAHVVKVDGFAFESPEAGVVRAEFVDGEGHDARHAVDERGQQNLDMPPLAIDGVDVVG